MTKFIDKIERQAMIKHLREISNLCVKANIKNQTVVDKLASHSRDLLKQQTKQWDHNKTLNRLVREKDQQINDLVERNKKLTKKLAKDAGTLEAEIERLMN